MKERLFKTKKLHPIIMLNYIPRIIGYFGVLLLSIAAVHGMPLDYSYNLIILAAGFFIIWPQAAFLISRSSPYSKQCELIFLIMDSFFIGIFCGLWQFQFWIILMAVFSTSFAVLSTGGLRIGIGGCIGFVLGALLGGAFSGYHVNVDSTLLIEIISLFGVIFFSALMGYLWFYRTNDLNKARIREQKAYDDIRIFNQVVQAASSTFEIDDLMKSVEGALKTLFNFDSIITHLTDQQRKKLKCYSIYAESDIYEKLGIIKDREISLTKNASITAVVFTDNKEQYLRHVVSDQDMLKEDRYIYNILPYKSAIILPLSIRNAAVGVVSIYSYSQTFDLSKSQIDRIKQYVAQISIVLNNALVYKESEDAKKEIEKRREELEKISESLSKYLSPQVYQSIFSGKKGVSLESDRKRLTVFFCDLPGFTNLANSLESSLVTKILNSYLDEMSKVAYEFGGTIDKYIGDTILIFFGDPETKGAKQDAVDCIFMALAMRARMPYLHSMWSALGIHEDLNFKAGINTGYVTVGNIGSDLKMDYTIIGSEVNLASRLETIAKPGEILISEEIYLLVKDKVKCKSGEKVMVKGVSHPVQTYSVIEAFDSEEKNFDLSLVTIHGFNIKLEAEKIELSEKPKLIKNLRQVVKHMSKEDESSKEKTNIGWKVVNQLNALLPKRYSGKKE